MRAATAIIICCICISAHGATPVHISTSRPLGSLAADNDNKVAIVRAGAIEPLVELVRQGDAE